MCRKLKLLLAIGLAVSLLLVAGAGTTFAITYTTLDDPLATPGYTEANGISGGNIVGDYTDSSGFIPTASSTTVRLTRRWTIHWERGGTAALGISGGNIVG